MKFRDIEHIKDFLEIIDSCEGEVYLTSVYGDKYNLKSALSQYVAVAALLGDHGEELELWADNKSDESKLLGFFNEHREVL